MEKRNVDFDIYNLSDIDDVGFQNCLIPSEIFDEQLTVGSMAICCTEKEEIFVCRLYSLENNKPKNYCFLDDIVQVLPKLNERVGVKLQNITALEAPIVKATKIKMSVTINKNLMNLNFNKLLLKEVLKMWLPKLVLYQNCEVQGDTFLKKFGIEKISLETDLIAPYKLNSETEITLTDVQYKETPFKNLELKGLESIIKELDKFIKDFTSQKQTKWNVKPSFNALLIGPTGSGKTSLCHLLFLENKLNVFHIKLSDIISQNPGETEERLRNIFNNAKKFQSIYSPNYASVIFIEDIDIFCPAVVQNSNSSNTINISSQIYNLLDDFHMNQTEIIIIATTSQIDKVDPHLRRQGRFEKEIQIPIPNSEDREKILRCMLETTPIQHFISDEIIKDIAEKTPGYVGADLNLVVQNVLQILFLQKKAVEIDGKELRYTFDSVLKKSKTSSIQSSDIKVYKCRETFDDIGGATKLKNLLKVSILTPLKRPEVFKKFNLQLPKGILLYGPPGCAKTTIAKCLANETNMTFISISGAEVYSPYVGNAEKYIVKIFDTARRNTPCLIFFDEIETLVGKRTLNSKGDVQTRILSALLQEMDGIGLRLDDGIKMSQNENHILVVGATNRPDMIDDALLRPGRFDKLIHVPAPDSDSRLAILELCKKKIPFENNLNLMNLVERTQFCSGADLCNLCNEAALYAFTKNMDTEVIAEDDFNFVLNELKPSLSCKQIDWYINFEKKNVR